MGLKGYSKNTIRRRRWSYSGLVDRVSDPLAATALEIEAFALSHKTQQTKHSVLVDIRQFYKWALRVGLIHHDPTASIELAKIPHRLPHPVSTRDLERLLASTKGDTRVMIILAAYAGLRISEIAALRFEDIEHDRLTVRNGKGGKDRTIPMADEITANLPVRPDGRVFPSAHRPDHVGGRIKRAMDRLQINNSAHGLRHSFGTELARRKVPIEVIAQMMGHADLATTRGYILLAAPDKSLVSGMFTASTAQSTRVSRTRSAFRRAA
jgi:integrase